MGAGTVATHLRTLENVSGAGSQMLCRNAKARGKHCENGPNVTPYPTTTSACGRAWQRPPQQSALTVRSITNLAVILITFLIQTLLSKTTLLNNK